MKKILAALLSLFGIGVLPMLMGPTGGYPYNPLFGNPTALGFVTIGTNAGVFNALNGSITFGPDSLGHTGAITNTGSTYQLSSGNRDLQLTSAGGIDLVTSAGSINLNTNQFRLDAQSTTTTGVIINNSWQLPKVVASGQSGGAGVCTVAANSVNPPTCAYVSAGRYTFTFAPAFNQIPFCQATISSIQAFIYVAAVSASAVTFQTLNAAQTLTDETFNWQCEAVS